MATPETASETKLPDFIRAGMDYFTGKTVSKTEFDAVNGKLTVALEKLTKAESDLTSATTRATTAEARVKEVEGQLAAKETELATLKSENTKFKETATTTEQQAARIAAAAGLPANNAPATDANGEAKTEAQLMDEFSKITDPKARGEFYQKHFAPKFQK